MRKFTLLFVLICFVSCRNEQKDKLSSIANTDILGNWSSSEEKAYYEFFYTESKMYAYNPNASSLFQYSYIIRNDSIFLHDDRVEFKNEHYKYYDKISKADSLSVTLGTRVLSRVKEKNTLEDFVLEKISHEVFDKYSRKRQSYVIPLDSLYKWSGEPINLDNLDK